MFAFHIKGIESVMIAHNTQDSDNKPHNRDYSVLVKNTATTKGVFFNNIALLSII